MCQPKDTAYVFSAAWWSPRWKRGPGDSCWVGVCPKLSTPPGCFRLGRNVMTVVCCTGLPGGAPAGSLDRPWQQAAAWRTLRKGLVVCQEDLDLQGGEYCPAGTPFPLVREGLSGVQATSLPLFSVHPALQLRLTFQNVTYPYYASSPSIRHPTYVLWLLGYSWVVRSLSALSLERGALCSGQEQPQLGA